MSLADAKTHMRQAALARRDALARTQGPHAAQALAEKVLMALSGATQGKTIAGYWPLGSEIDIRPTLEALIGAGARAVLPVAMKLGDALIFRRWSPGQAMEDGAFGTSHPTPSAETLTPDVILAPLLAFDIAGGRLGYGAGYYDRTLHDLRTRRRIVYWGVAFDEQQVPAVPMGPTDAKLDGIITDRRIITVEI
ncbi:MAG: 5-formyltetrahydrofolate cyclo-ligase [Rhodospirillaceae bacterium]|nr:5-formyltetrahydrofolate cyclo-ligase [Rhodospirillaceae bacterium]